MKTPMPPSETWLTRLELAVRSTTPHLDAFRNDPRPRRRRHTAWW